MTFLTGAIAGCASRTTDATLATDPPLKTLPEGEKNFLPLTDPTLWLTSSAEGLLQPVLEPSISVLSQLNTVPFEESADAVPADTGWEKAMARKNTETENIRTTDIIADLSFLFQPLEKFLEGCLLSEHQYTYLVYLGRKVSHEQESDHKKDY